ncbi:MAG: 2TM domain-containing protein [Streptosporangiaceae bacterium]
MPDTIDRTRTDTKTDAPAGSEELGREQAIKQIERRRRFRINTALSSLGMIILVTIWAVTEYHNAGGWPASGFSQSSGIHDVWNIWIVYPLLAWLFITAGHGWFVYGRKPISESEIEREIKRQAGDR